MSDEPSRIVYQLISKLNDKQGRLFSTIDGSLFAINQHNEEQRAGKVKYYFIDASSALDAGYSLAELFNMIPSLAQFLDGLYERHGLFFKKKIQNLLGGEPWNPNLFIIDRIEILPEFRGKGFFLKMINDGVQHFACGAELMALRAFPLQFEVNAEGQEINKWVAGMNLKELCQEEKIAFHRLAKYYQKFGFVRVTDSGIMVKSIKRG